MFHVVYDVKPFVVEGLELVISIVAEHVQIDERCIELQYGQVI